jgi:hypothetical protein
MPLLVRVWQNGVWNWAENQVVLMLPDNLRQLRCQVAAKAFIRIAPWKRFVVVVTIDSLAAMLVQGFGLGDRLTRSDEADMNLVLMAGRS